MGGGGEDAGGRGGDGGGNIGVGWRLLKSGHNIPVVLQYGLKAPS